MNDSIPALLMGGLLLCLGAGSTWYFWRRLQTIAETDELARKHAHSQARRRLQVSVMITLVGVLIPLGDLLPFFRRAPVAFVFFWVAVMVLAGWIGLLGIADLASSRVYHNRAARRLKQQQEELEAQLAAVRGGRGSRFHSDE